MYSVIAIDDEPMMRRALKALIDWNALDCELTSLAGNGEEAIELIEKYNPDIVICDIKMPKKSGIEVAEWIKTNNKKAEVILLTAFADFAYAREALRWGVTDYVVKDGAVDKIQEAIIRCKGKIAKKEKQSPQLALLAALNGSNFDPSLLEEYNYSYYSLLYFQLTKDFKLENVIKLIKEVFTFSNILIEKSTNELCMIIPQVPNNEILASCNMFIDMQKSLLNYPIYLSLSRYFKDIKELPLAYKECNISMQTRFFNKERYLVTASFMTSNQKVETGTFVQDILNGIKRGDEEFSLEALNNLFTFQANNIVNLEQIKADYSLIINYCEKLTEGFTDSEFSRNFTSFNFFEEYESYLREAVAHYCHLIKDIKESSPDIIRLVDSYIADHIEKPLSLSDIAAASNYNSSYLSRFYKQKSGITITMAINNKKIEKAKELLKQNFKVYEVAERLGFDDTTYFSTLFKKLVGINPKDYQVKQNIIN